MYSTATFSGRRAFSTLYEINRPFFEIGDFGGVRGVELGSIWRVGLGSFWGLFEVNFIDFKHKKVRFSTQKSEKNTKKDDQNTKKLKKIRKNSRKLTKISRN